jgi:hypothetical protein
MIHEGRRVRRYEAVVLSFAFSVSSVTSVVKKEFDNAR